MSFLRIPSEIRLVVYRFILQGYQHVTNNQQPANLHLPFLRTCKQIYIEATPIFRRYLSLRTEREIIRFLQFVDDASAALVTHLDVANDGRLVVQHLEQKDERFPVSQLHLAMCKMRNIHVLRVFDARASRPLHHFVSGLRFRLAFEEAMFANPDCRPQLKAYKLYINPSQRTMPFECLSPASIEVLRLTGNIDLPQGVAFPQLRHLVLDGVIGTYFDKLGGDAFAGSRLISFAYARRSNIGLAIGELLLSQLLLNSTTSLTHLVLLSSTQISTDALRGCLVCLTALEYCALGFVAFQELNQDFVAVLPESLQLFRLRLSGNFPSPKLIRDAQSLFRSIEHNVLMRGGRLQDVCLDIAEVFVTQRGNTGDLLVRWKSIAHEHKVRLFLRPWEEGEYF